MSTITYLHIHQSEGVVFDDIDKLNADLNAAGAAELLEDYTDNGFVFQKPNGDVQFGGREDEYDGYRSDYISVWGCIYTHEFQIIADHMTAGKLVINYDYRGDKPEFYVLEPDKVEKKQPTF